MTLANEARLMKVRKRYPVKREIVVLYKDDSLTFLNYGEPKQRVLSQPELDALLEDPKKLVIFIEYYDAV